MFRSLLVPLDGTPFGEHALPLAVSVARRTGAAIHLVHVHVPTVFLDNLSLLGADQDRAEQSDERAYLEEVAGRVVARAPGVAVSKRLLEGAGEESVASALVHHAQETQTDLIVLSSHGRRGLARWWLGSVADDLVHRTSLPLLAAPPRGEGPHWDPEPSFRHILVPLDGSPLAEQILNVVVPLGVCTGAEYTLLRVVEPAPAPIIDPTFATSAAIDTAAIDSQRQAAQEYLSRVAERLRQATPAPTIHAQSVLDPEPAEAILGFLHRRPGGAEGGPGVGPEIDLVALATHGRGGLSRLLLGSIADKVLQETTVPVLLQCPFTKDEG